MFQLDLNKCFTFKTVSYYGENNELKFDPPVYEQRYGAVVKILEHEYWRGKLKKIIDFGCAEMKLATLLKSVEGVQHILEVDIDEELMRSYLQRVKPLISDYIGRRKLPLRIDVYKGSIDASVNCIKDADAVIAIEVIEHLEPVVLEKIPYNIFGFIKPKVVIITTPNADFNILFQLNLPNGFRHLDHKFEWTRKQFKDWCINICERFPNYEASISGIGKGPPESRQYGHVSQVAVFFRKDIVGGPLFEDFKDTSLSVLDKEDNYKLLLSVEFPYTEDNRNNNQKIIDEAKYHIERYIGRDDRYWNVDKNVFEIPISVIFDFVFPLAMNEEELKVVLLANNYELENNVILVKTDDCNEDSEFYENNDGDDSTECYHGQAYCESDVNDENWD